MLQTSYHRMTDTAATTSSFEHLTALSARLREANPPVVTSIGECMVEVVPLSASTAKLGYAGDTYNFAHYLRLLLKHRSAHIRFATALGTDFDSHQLRAAWEQRGIGTDYIMHDPERTVGLYVARNKPDGSKAYLFYRDTSAARRFFTLPTSPALIEKIVEESTAIYSSAITLAVLEHSQGRERLVDLYRCARESGRVTIFDTNFRPRLWNNDTTEAELWLRKIIPFVDILLPTDEDLSLIFEVTDTETLLARCREYGALAVILKCGAKGCRIAEGSHSVIVPTTPLQHELLDTTAAGDAFNAAIIAGLTQGNSPLTAAHMANRVAAVVLQHPGALIPESATTSLLRAFEAPSW
ncbi:MAG: sugar kinase [Bdellovibrionales bacterium]|nr:sugar kinase [Bdellovibrionales bacterium]